MLKRAKAEAAEAAEKDAGASSERDFSRTVLDSSHQIWLAGLGAFSRAQREGMKMFETLVQQGRDLETKTRRAAADTAVAARDAAAGKARDVQKIAGGTWDRLEQVFEERVARALAKLGVHTQEDVRQLTERVDALSEAVNRLIQAHGSGREPAPRARSAKKARKSSAPAGTKRARKSPPKRETA